MNNDFGRIQWPVLVKYANYEELGYIADASGWESEVGPRGTYLNTADILMDSTGVSYFISDAGEGEKALALMQKSIDLDEALGWVRAHASLQGHCCVAKLYASSIQEVFGILESLDD